MPRWHSTLYCWLQNIQYTVITSVVQVGSPFTYFMFSKTVVVYLYICIDASRPSNENQIWIPYKLTLIFSIYTFLENTVFAWTKPLFKLIFAPFFKRKRRQSRVNSGLSGLSRPSRDSQLMTTNGKKDSRQLLQGEDFTFYTFTPFCTLACRSQ